MLGYDEKETFKAMLDEVEGVIGQGRIPLRNNLGTDLHETKEPLIGPTCSRWR